MHSLKVNQVTKISPPIVCLGFSIGVLCSIGVLSGDQSGRVNLLYLLFVCLLVPLIAVSINVISLIWGKGFNSGRLLSTIPIWSSSQRQFLHQIQQQQIGKLWFFTQSQVAAMAYSLATLLVFLGLLVMSDMNFVWRSTVLEPDQLLPVLSAVAAPWYWWDAAQPTLTMLTQTQDSRLSVNYQSTAQYGQWWQFVLAVHLVYGFALRAVLFVFGYALLKTKRSALSATAATTQHVYTAPVPPPQSAGLITTRLPDYYTLANWAGFSANELNDLSLTSKTVIDVGPDWEDDAIDATPELQQTQLLIVKSWEPPMGELADYMAHGHGLIMPIAKLDLHLSSPSERDRQEWLRFVSEKHGWKMYQPADWLRETHL